MFGWRMLGEIRKGLKFYGWNEKTPKSQKDPEIADIKPGNGTDGQNQLHKGYPIFKLKQKFF